VKKIYILAPRATVTGGPELSHQLGDVLNRDYVRAWIIYYPFGPHDKRPEPFQRYNVSPASPQDVQRGSIVVIPEVYPQLISHFPKAEIYFWWQSVDNFYIQGRRTLPGRLFRTQAVANIQLHRLRRRVHMHLYQSDYARTFLESVALRPDARLSDFLAEEYTQAVVNPHVMPRQNILVYNPAKGMQRTELILRALEESGRPMPEIVALRGMARNEIRELLRRAKVYIDFGAHPGKDRIPREAAALGACVLVNRRGSAANPVDVPIAEDFKIDDRKSGFEGIAAARIHNLMENFEQEQQWFNDYRQSIARERDNFLSDVRTIFPTDP
jgi:hypothetical protein